MQLIETYDVVVVGGGLAGFCAAVASARLGARTCLVQDRPVLGGNSSSEVRVQSRGAATYHAYAREGGIMQEIWTQERNQNHKDVFENGWANAVWDMTLYDIAEQTDQLTVKLNTSVQSVLVKDRRIRSVTGIVANAETEITFEAEIFIDCTGDALVADRAGCESRTGEESSEEFGEPHAPTVASDQTMGSSLHFEVVDTGAPVPYSPPPWAVSYDDDEFFYKGGRVPFDLRGGYWWIELGVPWHTIYENEVLRHELTRHTLGIWDWLKNRNPASREKLRNHALEWIGQVPGKRESRRILGLHLLTETDLTAREPFYDEVAYGGWNIDLHTPGGLLAPTSEPTAAEGYNLRGKHSTAAYVAPYGIPLRSLIARDVDNLLLAGRDISATHVALGSVRVQATCALMGQAVGTAAALAVAEGIDAHALPARVDVIQQRLLRDGCFLPNTQNHDALDLARAATASASSELACVGSDQHGWRDIGVRRPRNQELREPLATRRGQWIPLGPADEPIRSVSLLLENGASTAQQVEVSLTVVDHIWDYRIDPVRVVRASTLPVPPGESWVTWELDEPLPVPASHAGGYLRLDVDANADVSWAPAEGVLPGAVSAFEMAPGQMRRFRDGTSMAFRVSPPRRPWGPEQVITGESRPHLAANQWISDEQPLPQWVQLEWPAAQTISSVEVTFPGHLFTESDRYPSLYCDPQTARHYIIEGRVNGQWTRLVECTDNFHPRRAHRFEPAAADAVRITILATNGATTASIYEIRCYADQEVWSSLEHH